MCPLLVSSSNPHPLSLGVVQPCESSSLGCPCGYRSICCWLVAIKQNRVRVVVAVVRKIRPDLRRITSGGRMQLLPSYRHSKLSVHCSSPAEGRLRQPHIDICCKNHGSCPGTPPQSNKTHIACACTLPLRVCVCARVCVCVCACMFLCACACGHSNDGCSGNHLAKAQRYAQSSASMVATFRPFLLCP